MKLGACHICRRVFMTYGDGRMYRHGWGADKPACAMSGEYPINVPRPGTPVTLTLEQGAQTDMFESNEVWTYIGQVQGSNQHFAMRHNGDYIGFRALWPHGPWRIRG